MIRRDQWERLHQVEVDEAKRQLDLARAEYLAASGNPETTTKDVDRLGDAVLECEAEVIRILGKTYEQDRRDWASNQADILRKDRPN